MCIAVVGGIKRLEPQYLREAERLGIELRIFSNEVAGFEAKLQGSDAIIIFTNMVSHNARKRAKETARIHGIPVIMHHACGVCTLRECLGCFVVPNANCRETMSLISTQINGRKK